MFFGEVRAGHVRVRLMFRQNARSPRGLTADHVHNQYFLLYYQFVKHAFGLMTLPPGSGPVRLRLYFDQFPHTGEKVAQFKGFILGLCATRRFGAVPLLLGSEAIAEIRSHEHVLVQCLDVVLGAMAFRLNDMHKAIPKGLSRRGKRTRAKEQLYREILRHVRAIRPGFNIGITTGTDTSHARWAEPYLHWVFQPRDSGFDPGLTKAGATRKDPA